MTDIRFPQLSGKEGGSGVLATWYVADGDEVKTDQLVAEVAVDKVDAEVRSPADGVVRLQVAEGAEVQEGQPIAVVE